LLPLDTWWWWNCFTWRNY